MGPMNSFSGFIRLPGWALQDRLRAAGWHLLLSLLVAALAAALVFGLWYPGAFRALSGGRSLFLLVVSVDVVLGPLLTFAVFDLRKGWPHLRRDLAIIVALQLAALAYGLHTVYIARPVVLAFERDRFRVVIADDVLVDELPKARPEFRSLPLTGPWTVATRAAQAGQEKADALFLALKGYDTSQRPGFWLPYDDARAEVLARARPMAALLEHYVDRRAEFMAALAELGLDPSQARFLPVMARGDWVAVLDAKGNVATFLDADGFF